MCIRMHSWPNVFACLFVLFCALQTGFGAVSVQFDTANPQIGPFPSDSFTVADGAQITGRRVDMPFPDCDSMVALCAQLTLVNDLDGFNVQPSITVAFSGPVEHFHSRHRHLLRGAQ